MLLRALLDSPELRLRVLVGEDALDRPVTGVFTTDLLDPRRYLTGGEIVLTGLMWHRRPADSEAFVAAVVAAGAVALAAGDAALGSVPEDLVGACRRHQLPLFEVPVDVSFGAITEQVLAARLQLAGPRAAVARLRLLAGIEEAARPGQEGLAAAFAVASDEYGVAGWVMSAAGRLIAGVPPVPSAALRSALVSAWLGAGDLPATVLAGGAMYSLVPVAGQPGHRLAAWFVAMVGDQASWDADRRAIAAELAGLAAGYRARHEEGQRPVRRSADGALARVLDWRSGAPGQEKIAAALHGCGLPLDGSLVAVALTVEADLPGLAQPGQVARVLLEELLPAPVAGVRGAEAVALAPGGEDVVARLRDQVGALASAPGLGLAVGVSAVPGGAAAAGGAVLAGGSDAGGEAAPPGTGWTVAGLSRALAEARQARRLAAVPGTGVRLVDAAQVGSVGLLLAMVPGEARQAFRARLLDPLLDYDRAHGTELVSSLRMFLACSGSWTKAAEQMFVHVNSLRYRIRRVEELTGRDLGSLADQAALLLALRLAEDERAHLGGDGGVQAGEFPG